uniref:NADH-ubiquinone oxidoreductase chain 5 n=1 Tax=Paracladura trichoptera TaxID=1111055 RepID=G8J8J8_9DIPT|nr:NADH dehydrogenase subunit 5 [Paracladura trichoptera]AET13116.1 NADH dehydrogenase subunit 5 [Paracladura trichoptera]
MLFNSICSISFGSLFLFSISLFYLSLLCLFNNLVYFIEWDILTLNSCSLLMTFLFDWMSLLFMSFVLLISSLVIYYSKDYMHSDFNINRFILLILMFVLSMMLLIISPNLISILLGWDGLGLVSYCLVIYFQNIKSYNAGMLTALSNRIGDVAFLIAIAWMLNYGSWSYIFYIEYMKYDYEMNLIGCLMILAAMTKSAQMPFSSWLPAAMAAPTPVSALVHSSTLVTAGVYLLIRFNILFVDTYMSSFLLIISGLTMFMAGCGANFEFDLKKIIALSTLSQLGLMISILAMGLPNLAFFHLLTHALFKALLFMCAGSIIHNMKNSQDIRLMGGLVLSMPVTSMCLSVSKLSLCGMPFLVGFYSKDLILDMVSMSYINLFSFFLYFFSTGLTVCYSMRMVYYSLTGDFNSSSLHSLNDESWIMLKSMAGLLITVIIGGGVLSWLMFPIPNMICLEPLLKFLILMVCFMGGLIGYYVPKIFIVMNNLMMYKLSYYLGSMWYMPYISTIGINYIPLYLGLKAMKNFDYGWSEYFGGQLLYFSLKNYSMLMQVLQNNSLKTYFMGFILWVILLVGFIHN